MQSKRIHPSGATVFLTTRKNRDAPVEDGVKNFYLVVFTDIHRYSPIFTDIGWD
jgi:hypothetical protein